MRVLALRRLEVPVVPDASTARRWATEELADPVYHRGKSLLSRFLDWVLSLFDGASVPMLGLSPGVVAALVVALALVVVAVAFWIAGPVRLARRAGGSVVVLGNDTRTATDLRAAADASAARGDWSAAVLDRFRAIVRSLEERTLLDEWPGRTAHEAAEAGAVRLPSHTSELRRAGRTFDEVCYGKVAAGPDTDAWLRALDGALAATRPVAPVGRGTVDA
ncbi:DUF4129 domain-containing protein [Pengzhenrongella frigida]|uniref:DUF4129 domain-containing protein n=1 Tax=Pengzhenrongella frigida TaxID=1259133 RepID=A0A4Q5MX56_9MICO|nr:DUF4129 domain-containing protein [Cellulomonas sp. HLT2-17]RYV50186.1 DUF4129 domain-containing protein [Cellulomonas sp. HLT2-17]